MASRDVLEFSLTTFPVVCSVCSTISSSEVGADSLLATDLLKCVSDSCTLLLVVIAFACSLGLISMLLGRFPGALP